MKQIKQSIIARFFKERRGDAEHNPEYVDLVRRSGILGAIVGDIVGSVHEFIATKTTQFELFVEDSRFTDDTIMTIAVAEWLATEQQPVSNCLLPSFMRKWGRQYRYAGWGRMFRVWLFSPFEADHKPYNSFGNGSGMRVSACGFFAKSLDEALELAKLSAEVSHNHPEGIKGAQAIAAAIFLARQQMHKDKIRAYIEQTFGYNLHRTCDEIRPDYKFDETCQGSCPEAIIAFLDSHDFESAIRLAISLGGDSDTIGAMTGGIAAAYYGIPDKIARKALDYLPADMVEVVAKFEKAITNNNETPNTNFCDAPYCGEHGANPKSKM